MIAKAKKKAASAQARAYHYDVIVSPVITEKSTAASEHNKFQFNVRMDATKEDIRSAVEALFGVKVTKVNTQVRQGKKKRFRNVYSFKSDTKKAMVTLEKGQSIDLSSGAKG